MPSTAIGGEWRKGIAAAARVGTKLQEVGADRLNVGECPGDDFASVASGTSAAQVIRGFDEIGVECEKRQVEHAELAHLRAPAMLFVDHPSAGSESHAVAALRRDGAIAVYDPLTGTPMGRDVLAGSWHGRAVECWLRE